MSNEQIGKRTHLSPAIVRDLLYLGWTYEPKLLGPGYWTAPGAPAGDVLESIRRAVAATRPPIVVLSPYIEKNEAFIWSAYPVPRGHLPQRALMIHPSHRWAVERAGLTIRGVEPRRPAAWTLSRSAVAQARLLAVFFKASRIRDLVRWLERTLP